MSEKLHIEKQYSTPGLETYLIDGLSVEEMDRILNAEHDGKELRDVLADILDEHDNDLRNGQNIGTCWRWGYGIYSIRHFGGSLLVTVGNSCD